MHRLSSNVDQEIMKVIEHEMMSVTEENRSKFRERSNELAIYSYNPEATYTNQIQYHLTYLLALNKIYLEKVIELIAFFGLIYFQKTKLNTKKKTVNTERKKSRVLWKHISEAALQRCS